VNLQLTCLVLLLALTPGIAQTYDDTTPSVEHGASVFWKRCVLCHGAQGMGEGKIPLKIKDYPNTNILTAGKARTSEDIHEIIAYGGMLSKINNFMPPMGNELTWTELQSVTMFVYQLRKSPEEHFTMLKQNSNAVEDKLGLGLSIFQSRCVLCHGTNGVGDGRMAKVIKTPPPYDLTKSKKPEEYLKLIIEKGGEAMGRSGQMPPWGEQLSKEDIDAVASYIISIRK
jgi:cytochrome c oxidase cbb3-type subunit 3